MCDFLGNYFNQSNFWEVSSDISNVIFWIGILFFIWKFSSNAWPLFLRLPNPKNKKIAIVSENAQYGQNIKNALNKSDLFKEKNIATYKFSQVSDIKQSDLLIFDWEGFKETRKSENKEITSDEKIIPDEIQRVLDNRKTHAAVLFFAKPSSIPRGIMNELGKQSNVSTSNFLGRLVGDVLINLLASQTGK